MEDYVGIRFQIERNIKQLNGRLPEKKGNENSSKKGEIRMEGSEKWRTKGISLAPIRFLIYVNDMG